MTYKNKTMLNIIGHLWNANHNHNEMLLYNSWGGCDQNTGKITSVEDVEKLEPSHTTGRK